MNKICKKYISEVKALFPIKGKNERKYIEKLKQNLEDYCSETTVESKEQLYKEYSTPAQVVTDYFSTVDTEYLVKKVRFSKLIKWTFIIVIAIILIGASIYGTTLYIDYKMAMAQVTNDMSQALEEVNSLL